MYDYCLKKGSPAGLRVVRYLEEKDEELKKLFEEQEKKKKANKNKKKVEEEPPINEVEFKYLTKDLVVDMI